MSPGQPYESLPIAVELVQFDVMDDNCFRVILRLDDESYVQLLWPPDSPVVTEVLEYVTRLANERLAELGSRGVFITGVTPPGGDDD